MGRTDVEAAVGHRSSASRPRRAVVDEDVVAEVPRPRRRAGPEAAKAARREAQAEGAVRWRVRSTVSGGDVDSIVPAGPRRRTSARPLATALAVHVEARVEVARGAQGQAEVERGRGPRARPRRRPGGVDWRPAGGAARLGYGEDPLSSPEPPSVTWARLTRPHGVVVEVVPSTLQRRGPRRCTGDDGSITRARRRRRTSRDAASLSVDRRPRRDRPRGRASVRTPTGFDAALSVVGHGDPGGSRSGRAGGGARQPAESRRIDSRCRTGPSPSATEGDLRVLERSGRRPVRAGSMRTSLPFTWKSVKPSARRQASGSGRALARGGQLDAPQGMDAQGGPVARAITSIAHLEG